MPVDIVVGLTLAKNAFDLLKGVREALKQKKVTPDEMKDYLDTLQDKLGDIKTALLDADDANRKLRDELVEAKRTSAFGAQFTFEQGVYWHREYPYCPNCWDVDRTPIRLDGPFRIGNTRLPYKEYKWECPMHKSIYYLPPHSK